jgi:hypothetical protein
MIVVLLLVSLGAWAAFARFLGLDMTTISVGLGAITALGAPFGIAMNKALSRGGSP